MADTGKIAEVMFESALETYKDQQQMVDLVYFHEPEPGKLQNSGNVIWYPVEQNAPIISGWDVTGNEQDIIEETYPAILGTPSNDFVRQRADDLRDMRFWKRRGERSGKRQVTELNRLIAAAIATQGSLHVRTNVTSGYAAISLAQALMNERELPDNERHFMFNDRDVQAYSTDLAGRQTLQGRPEETWRTGQIGQNVAGFDVHVGSFMPNITGGADPAVTVTGNHSFAPEAGSVNTTTGQVTNVDYRVASIVVNDSSLVSVGDKVTFENSGTAVQSLALGTQLATGQPMQFTIIGKSDSTHIEVYPKPIAADDTSLTLTEAAYANIDTQILDSATLTRLNTDASVKSNLFWDRDAIEVLGGDIPAELFTQYDGMNVISDTMPNGLKMYMVFDGDISTMTFRYRLFTWWGITVCNPQNCGVLTKY